MSKKGFSLTSLSHKYVMAAAGAFLMLFLVSHLATNLLLLAGDGGELFDQAVEFLLTNPAIKIMEYVLFAGFIIHIIVGVILELHNRRSRPVGYHVAPKSGTSTFSKFMIHTGIIIFIFLLLHLYHFFFVKLGWMPLYGGAESGHDFYPMVVYQFRNPVISIIYIISFVFLGFHLKHAFQSAFQSFGLNHDKYMPAIKLFGTLYAIIIAVGFSIIPLYFMFLYK
ncbi:MAG: succinate dehydrogenase cytochrome b subunit [Bacteroidales bacterium]